MLAVVQYNSAVARRDTPAAATLAVSCLQVSAIGMRIRSPRFRIPYTCLRVADGSSDRSTRSLTNGASADK